MNIAGIIAEYNPLHLGHKHHIDSTRKMLGEDTGIVCVMSGNFVQRGEPAAFLKNARAEAAVASGADLVLELPVPWALSSAEGFARGAVGILGAAGVITHLSFGSEAGDVAPLDNLARLLMRPELDEMIKAQLETGVSYAAARQSALEELTGKKMPLLSQPNNILGIEYIKALHDQRLCIAPVTVSRLGAGHDEQGEGDVPSASALRRRLYEGGSIGEFLPCGAGEIFSRENKNGRGPVFTESLETAILSRLRMLPDEAFDRLPDAGEGLSNRLARAARSQPTLDAVLAEAKTKRYAMSRLRRMLMCAAIGITAEDSLSVPPYIRVLAANGRGTEILGAMRNAAAVPVITKPADANRLDSLSRRVFSLVTSATDLYVLGFAAQAERAGGRDWRSSPSIKK